jgi:hypothetical protein
LASMPVPKVLRPIYVRTPSQSCATTKAISIPARTGTAAPCAGSRGGASQCVCPVKRHGSAEIAWKSPSRLTKIPIPPTSHALEHPSRAPDRSAVPIVP